MDKHNQLYVDKVTANLMRELYKTAQLVLRLFLHPRVSLVAKIIPVVAFLYWLNPIDPLPPPLNLTPIDDIVAVALGLKLFIGLCPQDLVQTLRREIAYGPSTDDNEVIDTTYQVLDDDQ